MFETPEDPTERTRKALDHFLTKLAQEVVDELGDADLRSNTVRMVT